MAANYEQPEDVVTRVRFFDGQYLQDQDFIDDQHYHLDRQQRHNRLLHVTGIAEGLAVARAQRATDVRVDPGTAIDAGGRVIVLAQEPAEDRVVSLADFLGRTVNLYLVFQEVETQPQASGAADFGRWLEQPLLAVVDVQASHEFAHPPVLLAQVVLNNQGVERIELGAVSYAGVRLPGPAAEEPTLRTAPGGNVQLSGTLGVSGAVGVGTTGPAQALTVAGSHNAGKDPASALQYGGQVAIKGNAPQLDFIDTDGNDWAIHVNENKMYFVRQPWEPTDLVLDGKGNVGIGTSTPSAKLEVTGDAAVSGGVKFGTKTRQMLNLWETSYGIGIQAGTQYFRTGGSFAWYVGGSHDDRALTAGTNGRHLMALTAAGLGIGTVGEAENSDGYDRVLDVQGDRHAKFSMRTKDVEARYIVHPTGAYTAPGGLVIGTRTNHPLSLFTNSASRLTVTAAGNLAVGATVADQKLTVVGSHNAGKDPASALQYGGQVAIKGNAPQLDFIDTDGNDWAIHVNENKMYFVRQPWEPTDLVLDGKGNVGIGTSTPSAKLEVTGDAAVSGAVNFGQQTRQMLNLWNKDYGIGVQSSTLYFRSYQNFAWHRRGAHNDAEKHAGTGGSPDMVLSWGNLGIGTTEPAERLHVHGNLRLSNGGKIQLYEYNNNGFWEIRPEWNDANDPDLIFDYSGNKSGWAAGWLEPFGAGWKQHSDARLKDDVASLGPVLDGVLQLAPTWYRYKGTGPDRRRSIGFLAQDVAEVFPELVSVRRGYMGLGYSDFSVLAIAAIQEQQALIDGLRAEVRELAAAGGRSGE